MVKLNSVFYPDSSLVIAQLQFRVLSAGLN